MRNALYLFAIFTAILCAQKTDERIARIEENTSVIKESTKKSDERMGLCWHVLLAPILAHMDAAPYLVEIADAFAEAKLEAILIGNAGAALHSAPGTTVDFDFFYCGSQNHADAKIRQVAVLLGASISQPFPSLSSVYRILRQRPELQVDLTASIHGAKSFKSLRSQCTKIDLGERTILVASLADIIKSKKEANRPNDRAVLHVLEQTFKEQAGPAPDEA